MIDQGTESTTRVLDLLDALPVMILHVDQRGMIQFANKRARDRIGLPDDLEDFGLADILDESSNNEALEHLVELFNGEQADITSAWKVQTRAFGDIHVDTNAITIYENGAAMMVRLFLHDASDPALQPPPPASAGSSELKAALKEEQEYTKALIQKSGLMVYILDTKNSVVEINRKMEDVTGYSRETTPTLESLLEGLYPDDRYRTIVERIHVNMYKNQHIRETELSISTRAKEVKHVSWSTARLKNARGQVHGFIAMGMDVSDKKRLEQWVKLQSSCFDRVSDAVVVSDLTGKIINWVGGSERLLGFQSSDMVSKELSVLFPEEYRDDIDTALKEAIERDGKWSSEMVMDTSDGNSLAVRLDAAAILNEKGAPIALVSVIHDQTREKQFEVELSKEREEITELTNSLDEQETALTAARSQIEELEERVEQLANKNRDLEQENNRVASGRMVLESALKELQLYQLQILGVASVGVMTVDRSGAIMTWSQGMEELTGTKENDVIGHPHDEVFKLEEADWELLQAEASEKGRLLLPCTLITADDSTRPINLEATVLRDENDQLIGFTEVACPPSGESGPSPELELELFNAKSLGTLGELTAGFSRELGDAAGALNANWIRLQEYTGDLKKVVELYRNGVSHRDIEAFVRRVNLKSILSDLDFLFDESKEGLIRLRNLAEDIQSYLPDTSKGPEVIKLNAITDAAIALIRGELLHRAKIERNYHDAMLVSGNRNALMRAIIHIVVGSLQAAEGDTNKHELRLRTGLDGEEATLKLVHTGVSLDEGLLGRLEELNFLAAQPGSLPLNLGLANALVQTCGGSLEASCSDDGLQVLIKLHSVDGEQAVEIPPETERAEPEENVLFIDDDKNQLRSYRRYFERYFNIFQAETPEEARNALSVRQDFAAIVMDVLMPEDVGWKLYEDLVADNPQLKSRVIFLTPAGLSDQTQLAIRKSGAIVLKRPADFDSLVTLLNYVTHKEQSN